MSAGKTLRQQMDERHFAVHVTVYVHAISADEAQSYIETTLQDWSGKGRMIPAMHVTGVEKTELFFFKEK